MSDSTIKVSLWGNASVKPLGVGFQDGTTVLPLPRIRLIRAYPSVVVEIVSAPLYARPQVTRQAFLVRAVSEATSAVAQLCRAGGCF